MGKFNTKNIEKQPTEVNFMGETAFKMGAKEELFSTVMTTFLNDEYYESSEEKINRIKDLLTKVDPLFVAKLALYARNVCNMRSVTHLLSAELAKYISGTNWARRFYDKIVVRPDDMAEILCAYADVNGMYHDEIRKIPNAMKYGFKTAVERFDAYQLDKHKMKNMHVSLVDIIRLVHPKGNNKNREALKRLIEGKSLKDLYTSKNILTEMTKAGQETSDKSEEEKKQAKHDAIASVLDNPYGMQINALIKNLRNILIYAPDKVDDACRQLRIENKILKSRLLPFRFATAYFEIEKMKMESNTSRIIFESDKNGLKAFEENKKKILDALEDAIQFSVKNIPVLEGNTAILIDHSGSVRGDGAGDSRVSAFSDVHSAMIGNLFGSMLAYRQNDVYVGMFGDRLIDVPMNRDKKILEFNRESYNLGEKCGGATEDGLYIFLDKCIKEKKKVDNLVIFSDMQIGSGGKGGWDDTSCFPNSNNKTFQDLFNEFRKYNPLCNTICVNINQSGGTSVFDRSMRILNIAGWSERIFDVIKSNCKGFDEIIKEIDAIEI